MVSKLIKKNCLYYAGNIFLIFLLAVLSSFDPNAAKPYGLATVVIDAGHGGHDSGCLGKKSKEKDIALGISLKLGKYIESHFPEVKVIYTRKTDQFVELYERADIANNAKADLFICIHCNSACVFNKARKKETCSTEISGVESWVMGLNKTEANLEVSKRENDVILLEKDYTRKYGGFDPNSPEANIIFSLYQNSYLDQSLRMASFVQQEMKGISRTGRGVKQAGFLVLYKTSMPSILIETGFLSNASEEKFLSSDKGQDQMAKAIFSAFKSYKNSVESQKNPSMENDTPVAKKKTEVDHDPVIPSPDTSGKEAVKSIPDTTALRPTVPVKPNTPSNSSGDGLRWSVQIYTSPKPIADNNKVYSAFPDAREDFENGLYKYSTGYMPNKNDAVKLQNKLRQEGSKDAFVVSFFNGKKISLKEANDLLNKK